MNLTDIFKTLADYLNFVIDFLSWRALTAFSRLDDVNAELVSFFVTGIIIAFIISFSKKLPSYLAEDNSAETTTTGAESTAQLLAEGDEKGSRVARANASSPFSTTNPEILGVALLSFVTAFLFHLVFVAYNWVYHPYTIGSLKDTVNAFMAPGRCSCLSMRLRRVSREVLLPSLVPFASCGWHLHSTF